MTSEMTVDTLRTSLRRELREDDPQHLFRVDQNIHP